ncbi:hypothetical protein [Sulfuriflexus mobilis]|uniref:hypothetical protein n=1 Tax=Sulfuriflexus mobilis TaxID=1811807 RepID=UPI000F83F2C2|nr:hypothetical protein [Sulfuriflexus mobilis]
MYKRKTKPDLLFILTIFVCLGVLVTATVNADEWGINLSGEAGCSEAVGEWQGCSQWLGSNQEEPAPNRAALRLSSDERPGLGLVWYYTQSQASAGAEQRENALLSSPLLENSRAQGQFGLAVKQQYRHFGLSLGIEAERPEGLTDEPLLYFGLSNRW